MVDEPRRVLTHTNWTDVSRKRDEPVSCHVARELSEDAGTTTPTNTESNLPSATPSAYRSRAGTPRS
jgi:hypothetical protein